MIQRCPIKLKYIANYISRGDAPTYVENVGVPVVNQGCVWSSELNFSKVRYHDPKDVERIKSWIHKGDILINSTGTGTLGRVSIVDKEPTIPTFVDGHVTIVRDALSRYYPKFLFHYLSIQQNIVTAICSEGATNQIELSRSKFGSFTINLPPISEQRAIANYLDHETAKIDTLISARERLLDLLTEKRRALITHAVTRGLNPDVSLQNSSFEFFKYIPEHWEVINLKFLTEVRTGVTKGRNFGNRETVLIPYFRVANVQDGYLDLSDIAQIEVLPEEISSFKLEKGDVLMNEGGDADKLGRGAVWDGSIDPCLHQNHVFAVRCHNIEPEWLTTVIGSHYAKAYFESRSKQSTNLASISTTNIKELPIVVPPPEERKAIIEYLKEATSKLERLSSVATSTIELLHERRTALITAAVTGQISVTM
ncbi:MAG: restriction endonuclease subunit S [Nostoc sp.]|uniref:restriction endonuclease subunit S n=1 Tax=Nostoc sp. TaxID=1180 RepID=UPI002FF8999B